METAGAWSVGFPPMMWVLPLVAAALCAIGYKKFVWFISVGYGFAVAGEGVAMLCLFAGRLTLPTALLLVALTAYALRLGGYLALREIKSASYRKAEKDIVKDVKHMGAGAKTAIWISVTCLYVAQVSPVFYRLSNGAANTIWLWAGLCVMLLGFGMEALADRQKARAKKQNPDRFCDTGLFRFVRCPNYLGELLLWTGVFLSGFGALTGPVQWAVASFGYVCIVYIMFSGARRLEIRQNKRYGGDPAYDRYVRTTPIMIPFVPLYSVENWTWIVC